LLLAAARSCSVLLLQHIIAATTLRHTPLRT
jgi:hypothetical protein